MADVRLKGFDISVYQKGINFDTLVSLGVKFIIMRAGAGSSKDSQVDNHVRECEKRNIPYGFYWYSYAKTPEAARNEARKCLEVIKNYNPTWPVYYDIEDKSQINGLTRAIRTDMVIQFCEVISEAGYIAGLYANPSWLISYLDKSRLLGKYELWLACWTENPNVPTKYNYGQKVWQWGADTVNGHKVDGDLAYYDYGADSKSNLNYKVTVGTFKTKVEAERYCEKVKADNLTAEISSFEAPPVIPEEPPAEETDFPYKVGDKVKVKECYHYAASDEENPVGGKRTAGLATVTIIAPGKPHPIHLVGERGTNGSDVLGWCNLADAEKVASKTIDQLAREVIQGKWGAGVARKEKLTAAGYDYAAVQRRVNELLK